MPDRTGALDGDRLFYRGWTAPQPPANVVLVHGYGEHSGRYEHVGEALVAAGFAAWAPDHRGHGRSAGTRGDIESIAATVADLDLLVDAVTAESDAPIVLVGHSMGTIIATAYAEAFPARLTGLALSAPITTVPQELLALADLAEIPELGLADGVSRDPAVIAAYKDDPLNHLGAPPRGFILAMRDVVKVTERLPELTLPVLVMHGSGDLLASPQGLRDVVAGVSSTDLTARLWPGLFHEIFNEPERADVLAFLVAWLTARAG